MTKQRPPRAPGTQPKRKTYESPTMAGFRQKVAAANQTTICNATNVGRITTRELLTKNQSFEVPIFQRRYCWTSIQWKQLLSDAMFKRNNGSLGSHSLGRLTCTNVETGARSCILDGQQRFTTVTILLASIRDAIVCINQSENDSVVKTINNMLFPDNKAFYDWAGKDENLLEGTELSFAKLTPSFYDRKSTDQRGIHLFPLIGSTSSSKRIL